MKEARIFMHDIAAGTLREDDEGFHFTYHAEYLENARAQAISLALPLRTESYHSKYMFPFFDGLIPEGWLLQLTLKNWKIDVRDRMSLLLVSCADCIGAVTVQELNDDDDV